MSEGLRHRGWVVVFGTFLLVLMGFGSLYSFGAFFNDLSREFDANRANVSLVFALASAFSLSVGALSGPVADRVGPRVTTGFGAALAAAGLWLAGSAQSLMQIYLAYAIGLGFGLGCFYVPAIGTVQRWFVRRRAFASGIAVSGIGLGTLVLPRLAVFLIQTYGWRDTYRIFAVAMLVAGVIGILCIEHSPERRAAARGAGPAVTVPLPGATVGEAARTRSFWLLYAASAFSTLGLFVPFVHLAPYAVDHGLSKAFGVTLIGLIGVGSLVGRLGLGTTADRMGRRGSLLMTMAGMALTTAVWLIGPYPILLAGFALSFGVFYGGFVALMPSVVMDYFGSRNVSAILGALYTGAGVAALFGPTLAGYAFDQTHSYITSIVGAVAAQALAALCVLCVPDPQSAPAPA